MNLYLSHHKCATKYALTVLRTVGYGQGWNVFDFHAPDQFDGDLASVQPATEGDLVFWGNAEWEHLAELDFHRACHVVRDPRDMLVSAYFSHRESHSTEHWPELEGHRRRLRSASKAEGLMMEIEFMAPVFQAMEAWDYGDPRVREVRFEDLVTNPSTEFLGMYDHWGLLRKGPRRPGERSIARLRSYVNRVHRKLRGSPDLWTVPTVHADDVLAAVRRNRFEVLSGGRARGTGDPGHHYRKGEPGDWENHLDPSHLSALERSFGGLLERRGNAADG